MQNGARPCIQPACTRVTLGTKWNPRSISALSSPMFASPRSALGLRRSLVRSKNLGKESPGTGTRPGQTDRHYKCHPSQHKHPSSHLSHVTRVHVSQSRDTCPCFSLLRSPAACPARIPQRPGGRGPVPPGDRAEVHLLPRIPRGRLRPRQVFPLQHHGAVVWTRPHLQA